MKEIGGESKQKRFFSYVSSLTLIMSAMLIGISIQIPNAAATINHDVGNLQINELTDFGRIRKPISWGGYQTTNDPMIGIGFIGLVIDQANYDHAPGSEDIADSFPSYPYATEDDLKKVDQITMGIDDGITQKSIASFNNSGLGTGDPFDIHINQTVWTVVNKDWAILQWTLLNLKSLPLNNVCIGLELPLSQVGAGYGLGGDSGDDIDGFDGVDDIYWAQDDDGTAIGFGSAIALDPITHYYSEDYHPAIYDDYKVYWQDDSWLYNRLHAPNSVEGSLTSGNRTSTVGWNGIMIDVGKSRTFTLVIAINDTFDNMKTALNDARYYYHNKISGFWLTEISDSGSGSAKIEVFNFGREPTNIGSVCSLSANVGTLTGNWNPTTIQTYGYSVFTPNENIDVEGDTIRLYENSVLIDVVAYGQDGVAPDPLYVESVARRFNTATASYTNDWLRNASTGHTFGAQNNVGSVVSSPQVVLNRVMFNPMDTIESYVELMYNGSATLDISGYRIVCDDAFIVPPGTELNSTNRYYVLNYSTFSQFFTNMSTSGDNVYLYDNDGNLLDMVGWSSSHTLGRYMSRMPDGCGAHQGFDDTSSQAAGWVFDQIPSLMITELYADSTSAQIELYNPRGGDKVLDAVLPHWTLESNVNGGTLTGTWNLGIIPANGGYDYFTMDPGGGTPGEEGDAISLYYLGSILIDRVSFGTYGVAPDPLWGESTARFWDDFIPGYNNNWTRNASTGPTWSFKNDAGIIISSPQIVLNRVMFYPMDAVEGYVELMYKGSATLDISGYRIVCDDEFIVPSGTVLNSTNRFYVLNYSTFSQFFGNMSISGDNVYLYDNNCNLLDMAGWSSPHTQGYFMSRIPDGDGTHQGYNDVTSQAAGWVFDHTPNLMITEFYADNSSAQIELYNPRGGDKDLDPRWAFSVDSGALTGTWTVDPLPNRGYSTFTMTVGTPGDEGDTIRLFYTGSILIDEVSFGIKGVAPDPLLGESTARYWDNSISEYNNDWTRAPFPTFGTQNDVPPPNFSSRLSLNDIMFNPIMPEDGFVEIYHKWGGLNISGYKIVGDREYIIPPGTKLLPNDPFFYLRQPMNLNFFGALNSSGDNVYLYDDNGRLLDMAGWSSSHLQGETMSRIPNGNGTRDGFDDASSTAAGWVFGCDPTVHMVKVGTRRPIEYGNFGDVIYFNLTVTNKQSVDDTILIFNSTLNGYPVIILDETGTFIISEVFVPSGSCVNILVLVILPSTTPFIEWDNITITIQSQNTTMYKDSVILQAVVQGPVYAGSDQIVYEGDVVQFNGTAYPQISYPVWPVDISGNGHYMAIGWDKNVTFFSTASNLPLWTCNTGGRVGELKLTEDGKYLVVGSYKTVYFFDTASSNPLWSVNAGEPNVRYDSEPGNRLDMTRDGKYIAAVAAGGRVKVYDTTSATPTVPYWDYNFGNLVNVIRFSGNGNYLGMGADDLCIFRLGWIPNRIINWTSEIGGKYYSASLSYDGSRISTGQGVLHEVKLFSPANNDPIWYWPLDGTQFEQDMSDDGVYLVTSNRYDQPGSWNGFAFWNTSSKNPLWTYSTGARTDAVDMDRDANYVVGGSRDNNVYLFTQLKDGTPDWSSSDGVPIFTYTTGDIITFNSVSISSDGTYFAAGSRDGSVYLFSTSNAPHLVWSWCTSFPSSTQGPLTYNWDVNSYVDSDGDGNLTNDVDATGPAPTHIYGDNGVYTVTLTVTDNQSFLGTDSCIVTVNNVAPTIEPFGPFTGDEGVPFIFDTNATDLGSDDLTFTWNWGDGTSDTITVYYNDGIGPDPYPSPNGTFPFSEIDTVQHTYLDSGNYTINLTVEDDDGGVTVYTTTVTVNKISTLTPTLYINVSQDGKDVILYWDPPSSSDIQYYLIYRSVSQTGFDFNTIWVNTSSDMEPGESGPIPLRTMWNDTNAAFPDDESNYKEQYYYTIRVVNILGEESRTSRTVGKWTTTFSEGVSTFSLPLEPLENMNKSADYYLNDMNARYIKWMDPSGHTWMKHGDGGDNDTLLEVGKGYEVFFDSSGKYTFLGMPGAMIRYNTGDFVGFDYNTNAKTLQVMSASPVTGDVTLTWDPVLVGMDDDDDYYVYYSTTRNGFDGTEGSDYILLGIVDYTAPTLATHSNALLLYPQLYYMVIPVNETGVQGASTYSIGVWTEEYLSGYDTFGIPLKLSSNYTADWYCDNIPDTVGINYYIYNEQRWSWHSKRMPIGAYDPILVMTEGYQISTSSATKFIFIGT